MATKYQKKNLEVGDADYVLSSCEYDGKAIGYILNIQSFLDEISLKNSGYKIVLHLVIENGKTIALEEAGKRRLFLDYQEYTYEIARLGELQVFILSDSSLNAQLWRMQFLILLGIFCIVIFVAFGVIKFQNLQEALHQQETAEQKMETEYLKGQIRPHFFLNCMNLIHGMAEQDRNNQIAYAVGVLSEYMRYMLKDFHSLKRVKEEIDHIEKYVEICHLRYGDVFEFECMVDEEAKDKEIFYVCLE